jgi:serine/threonine-protein kinase
VAVPNLIGRVVDDALFAEMNTAFLRLNPFVIETDEVAEGEIVSQVPSAGQQVPGNTLISIGVAVAPIDSPVPDVIGLTEAVARQSLAGDGFLQEVTYETDPDPGDNGIAPGTVWAQDPPGGTERGEIDTVRLKVNPFPDEGDGDES